MVVADVEGHVTAMGDRCSEPARGFWKNVRTQRTQPVGRGPMEIMRGRALRIACRVCGGVGMPSAEDDGAMAGCLGAGMGRTRNMHYILIRIEGISTPAGLGIFSSGCWGVRGGVAGCGKIRDGTGKTYPFAKLPRQAGAGRAGSQGAKECA
jgi:hypothetical protein